MMFILAALSALATTSFAQSVTCAAGATDAPCDSGPCLSLEHICVTLTDGTLGCCPGDKVIASCPTTVSSNTAAACVDLVNPVTGVSDCPRRASLCTDPTYLSVMQVQCRRTCGFCSSTGVTSSFNSSISCVDQVNAATGTSDCPSLVSLCTNSAYTTLMTQQCPKTCGFC